MASLRERPSGHGIAPIPPGISTGPSVITPVQIEESEAFRTDDSGWTWKQRQFQPLSKKDKVGFIVALHPLRFVFFLEFHKQLQRCASFGSQADVFVAFSSAKDLKQYWEDFQKVTSWRAPPEWGEGSAKHGPRVHESSTAPDRSIPSCMNAPAETQLCEEDGITSIVVPSDQFTLDPQLNIPRAIKKFWAAAWVISNRPGYRFLALPDAEMRIASCRAFEEQSLLTAVEESYARKRWTGSPCAPNTCAIQLNSADAVTRSDAELSFLKSRNATRSYTWQTEFPWVEVTSFTKMLRALASKHKVDAGSKASVLDLVQRLHHSTTYMQGH